MKNKLTTFDGVYLTIDQHEVIDLMRARLIEAGRKDLSEEYSNQMHSIYSGLQSKWALPGLIAFSWRHVCLMKEISLTLNCPRPKFKPAGPPANFGETDEELRIEPNGNISILPADESKLPMHKRNGFF